MHESKCKPESTALKFDSSQESLKIGFKLNSHPSPGLKYCKSDNYSTQRDKYSRLQICSGWANSFHTIWNNDSKLSNLTVFRRYTLFHNKMGIENMCIADFAFPFVIRKSKA